MSTNRVVTVIQDEQHVITEVCNLIENIAKQAIEKDDVFKVGLSGIHCFQTYKSLNILKWIQIVVGHFKCVSCHSPCSQVDHSQSFYPVDCQKLIPTGQNGDCFFVMKGLYRSRVQIQRTESTRTH